MSICSAVGKLINSLIRIISYIYTRPVKENQARPFREKTLAAELKRANFTVAAVEGMPVGQAYLD